MQRILFLCFVIVLVVTLAVPCFALQNVIDPIDYIVTESANGDNNWINVSIPSSAVTIKWDKTKNGSWTNAQTGSSATFPADLQSHDIYSSVTTPIDITSIIDGTTITMQYSCTVNAGVQPQASNGRWFFRYLDVNGAIIRDQVTTINITSDFDTSYISVIMDKPDNAVAMNVYYQWLDTTAQNSFTININSINFSCLVSALQRVQQETGKTNELLEEVINGYVPDSTVPGGGVGEDLDDKQQDALNQVGDGSQAFEDVQVGVLDSLALYATSFLAVGVLLDTFLEIDFVDNLFVISLAVGSFALLLGLVLSFTRRNE